MYFGNIVLVATLSLSVIAQKIDSDEDVPPICRPACAGVIVTGRRCHDWFDKDRPALECVCNTYGMPLEVPSCEACVATYLASRNDNIDEEDYDDISELRSACGFSTLTASVSAAGPSAKATALGDHLSRPNGVAAHAVPVAGLAAGILGAVMVTL